MDVRLLHEFPPTQTGQKPTKTSQTLQESCKSGWCLLQHQIWSTWWKNRGLKATYVYRDLRVKYSFWLLDFQDKFEPLSTNRNHPKFHRLFRTIVNPVGAFYRIKFGQFDGKIRGQKPIYVDRD